MSTKILLAVLVAGVMWMPGAGIKVFAADRDDVLRARAERAAYERADLHRDFLDAVRESREQSARAPEPEDRLHVEPGAPIPAAYEEANLAEEHSGWRAQVLRARDERSADKREARNHAYMERVREMVEQSSREAQYEPEDRLH